MRLLHVRVGSDCLLLNAGLMSLTVFFSFFFIRTQQSRVSGAVVVGETPEKKQNRNTNQPSGSKLIAQKTDAQCVVADSMSSSYNMVEHANLQRKRPESSLTGTCTTH